MGPTCIHHYTRASLAAAMVLLAGQAGAAPGDLDVSFGTGGKVTTPVGSNQDSGAAMAIQSDGKIVVAGYSSVASRQCFALVRYTSTGALDTSFGTGGKITTLIGSGNSRALSVAVQSDGRIVAAGQSFTGSYDHFTVVRYNANGTFDSSFGSGGIVTTPTSSGAGMAESVAVQSDGKIVVGGQTWGNPAGFALVRYTSTGALDSSFGNGGIVIAPTGSSGEGFSVAVQSDGKTVVARGDFTALRYTAAGVLDATFAAGTEGVVDFGVAVQIHACAIQPEGKVLLAGHVGQNGSYDIGVVRRTATGALDPAFGAGGKVRTDLGNNYDNVTSMAVQPDGKIVAAGSAGIYGTANFAVVRYLPNGDLDPSFGIDGRVTTDFASNDDYAFGMALQSDGKIVVAGQSSNGSKNDFALVRYQGADDMVPDTLRYSIPSPPTGLQSGAGLGASVATNGTYVVVGAPNDDLGGENCGAVKVFDASSGALLWVLPKPVTMFGAQTANYSRFGTSVAISGTRVVVGAYQDAAGGTNAGNAYVFDLSSATPTVPVATLNNPSPASADWFGYCVAIDGTRVVIGAPLDDAGGSNAGRTYVYDLAGGTPTVPVVTLDNPAPLSFGSFGWSVAVSGTRVVAATRGKRVYVYDLAGATPFTPALTLPCPGTSLINGVGTSVAISGTLLVVGSPADDMGGPESASVYDLAGATPTAPVATLQNPLLNAGEYFGNAVAISGARVVVGAFHANAGPLVSGIAYVYDLNNGTPTAPIATLNNPTPTVSDQFGTSVAISGTRVVVGADGDDTGATDAGSAYVYELASAAPTVPVALLNNPGPTVLDFFGRAVAVSGTRMVVGAPADGTGGSAYVYDLMSGAPTVPEVTLSNPTPADPSSFGSSVGISGTRVVIGSPGNDTGAMNAGCAYVYDVSSATPAVPVATLTNPSPAASDNFGWSVAVSGTRVVVGAYADDTGATDAGSAYVYDLASATPTVPVATLNNPTPATNDWFGRSVAISGTRVVVGAYCDDTGATDAGSVYVYDLTSATQTVPVTTLNDPSPVAGDGFGYSMAISGARVVVGAVYADVGAVDTGVVYAYDLAGAAPTIPTATLNAPAPVVGQTFGWSLDISGSRIVVASPFSGAGAAYVYDLTSGTPTVPSATLNNPEPTAYDYFSLAVAIDGDTVVIGTPGDDTTMTDKGSTYVFGPANPDYDGDGLLDIWEEARFGSITAHTATDDTDGDGRTELLEQAFDTDPNKVDLYAIPAVVSEGGFLTITLTKRAGVNYTVETAGSPNGAAFSMATTTIITNNATTLKVRDNFTPSTAAQRYMRVKVNAAP